MQLRAQSLSNAAHKMHRYAVMLAGLMLLSACATTSIEKIDSITQQGRDPIIALMPLDVEVSLLTAGGMSEPNAEWTSNATENLLTAIKNKATADRIDLEVIGASALEDNPHLRELESLHRAVGQALLVHHVGPEKLPTKKDNFDWSLGEGAQLIGERYDADYAMYFFFRNSYSSGGRVALTILAAIASGGYAILPAAPKYALASLVDTRTGEIVWFDALNPVPDIRKPESAVSAVDKLLDTLPNAAAVEADES